MNNPSLYNQWFGSLKEALEKGDKIGMFTLIGQAVRTIFRQLKVTNSFMSIASRIR